MYTYFQVNNLDSELTGNYISLEKVCHPADKIPETDLAENTFFVNKSYTIVKEEIKDLNESSSLDVAWEFIEVTNVSSNELSHTIWNHYLETQYEDYAFEEKPLKSAKKQFTTYLGKICKKIKKIVYNQDSLEKTYFSATGEEFVFWYDDFSVVYDLSGFNLQISNILFQCLVEDSQQQLGPVKGWFLDVTRTKHSRAKWAYALSQNSPLLINGLNRILGVIQRFNLSLRTHRDTKTTYLQRSIAKCFVKLKNGIRSVEEITNGDKEKSDSKGQRLGISQAYSRYYTWT